jgi:hypothetical protein
MSSYVGPELRRLVRSRASGVCEYCLVHEDDTVLGNEIDHIISEKHGGPTEEGNLAFTCRPCNRNKGSDIASIVEGSDDVIRLFNPRRDKWNDHFTLIGVEILGRTPIGKATARLLAFNEPIRLQERQAMIDAGRFPSDAAAKAIKG